MVACAAAAGAPAAHAAEPADAGAWNVDPALASAPFPLSPVPVAPTASERTYAIHAALLPTGKVLFFGPRPPGNGNISEAYLWDPAKGYDAASFTRVPPPAPIFCGGQSFLPDGRLLVTGGNYWWEDPPAGYYRSAGTKDALVFDPWSESWSRAPDLDAARYYPTQTELADGRTIVLAGYTDEAPGGVDNPGLDVYTAGLEHTQPATGERARIPGARQATSLYPRTFLMPDQRVLLAGPASGDTGILDPALLTDTGEAGSAWQNIAAASVNRHGDMTVLMPAGPEGSGRALALGGWNETDADGNKYPAGAQPALSSSESVDGLAETPQWTAGPALNVARDFANAVLLPDASIAVVGGAAGHYNPDGNWAMSPDGVSEGGPDAPLHHVELYDPATHAFRLGAAQVEDRAYHSTALLLPDGRVFSAGDDLHPKLPDGSGSTSDTAEIYSPPYLFKGPRPTIDAAPAALHWGDEFGIASDDPGLAGAVLIAPGATTHSFDMSQRYVPLRVTAKRPGAGLDVAAPPSPGVAPPGYYMLWLLDDKGIPSLAKWVRLGADAPDQPVLGSPQTPPAQPAGTVPGRPNRIRVTLSRHGVGAGRRTRVVVRAWVGPAPLAGARVQLAGSRARTGRTGRARLSVVLHGAGVRRVRVTRPGLLPGHALIAVRKRHRR